VVDELPMAELAARWSELLIADVGPGEMLTEAAQTAGSLLRQPATEEQIRATESRLGRTLPASYRQFLLASNGAYGDNYGPTQVFDDVVPENPSSESDVVGVGFLPVEDLRWLRDAQEWFADMLVETAEFEDYGPATVDRREPPGWAPLADGLVIATEKHPGTTVLIPFDGLDEWQLWNVHKETTVAYLSFRSFLEYEVTERERVSGLEEVRSLIARGSAGDHEAVMRLSRVDIADAVPLLIAALDNPRLGVQPALGLARLGTPEAVTALIELGGDAGTQALILVGTERARDALAAWGNFSALFKLRDARAFALAAQHVAQANPDVGRPWALDAALTIVGHSADPGYVPLLMPLLQSCREVSYGAAIALARLGATEGAEHLAVLAETPEFSHRAVAAAHLERFRKTYGAG
jgi:SMI1 / KNR4 family (SUKH-1)